MAQENLQSDQNKKAKCANLERRRNCLRTLLTHEKEQLDEELKSKSNAMCAHSIATEIFISFFCFVGKSQTKSQRMSTQTLKDVNERCKRTEEERKRLELESKLYKRWRYGLSDDVLFEAKSDHTALAKMNWLDKQVRNSD